MPGIHCQCTECRRPIWQVKPLLPGVTKQNDWSHKVKEGRDCRICGWMASPDVRAGSKGCCFCGNDWSPVLQTSCVWNRSSNLANSKNILLVYETEGWYRLRDLVLYQAGYTCHMCAGMAMTAHHITYKYGILCHPRWLRAMCWRCHKLLHGIRTL